MKKLLPLLLSVGLISISCDLISSNDDDDDGTVEIHFANSDDSEYSLSGFWLAENDESFIPDGKQLDPGEYFIFEVPNSRTLHEYRVAVLHDSEIVYFEEGVGGYPLSISTEIGNPRYAHIRITNDPPRVSMAGCSAIGHGSSYDKEYDLADWAGSD
ncbi:hypothetical protein QLX67_13000 [Balneolaceae bacterium ANBcel3]|nr:hypothetical protein [Balneolaceae bacterium ANBcel3]